MTNVYHPAPLNQFYRLDRDTPTSPYVKTSRWNHIHANSAGKSINWDGYLCMATAGGVTLDGHTIGKKRTSPGGIHDHQDDNLGGIGVDDVRTAWYRGWGELLYTPAQFDWNDSLYQVRAQRRVMIVGVDYEVVPYADQVQKNGRFDHAIVIEDFRPSDGAIKCLDTLDTAFRWKPQRTYRPAAEALAQRVRGTKASLFVAFSKPRPLLDDEPLYRLRATGGLAHKTPLYDKPYGKHATDVSRATYVVTRHSVKNPTTGKNQWWYQVLPNAATDNRGLWISPTRYTEIDPL